MNNHDEPDADAIIESVLGRFQRKLGLAPAGSTRAAVVVDADVAFLGPSLEEASFRVIVPSDALIDFDVTRWCVPS